ncbi:MAG: hypothetical protein K8L91_30055 [Anaerolineae bacterium]|nr:hypothetical protein [Anaerolineae bacterium]
MSRKFTRIGLLLIVALLVPMHSLSAVASDVTLVAGSTGLIDEDGTVLYSVILASGDATVESVSIQAQIPTQATFVEALEFPESAALAGQVGTAVTWEVASLEANSILGPFTFRVSFPEAFTDIPKGVAATITWISPTSGIIDATPEEGILKPLADSGQIVVDARGTLNEAGENVALPVGETGIELLILPDTVAAPTTFTFRRIPITEDNVPSNVDNTWWCVLFEAAIDPAVELLQPIAFSIPTRRVLTPGLETTVFINQGSDDWQEFSTLPQESVSFIPSFAKRSVSSDSDLTAPAQFGGGCFQFCGGCFPQGFGGFGNVGCGFSQFGGGFGGGCVSQFGGQVGSCTFGVGVNVEDRARALVTADNLQVLGLDNAVEFFSNPPTLSEWIKPQ